MDSDDKSVSDNLLSIVSDLVSVVALPMLSLLIIVKVGLPEFARIAKAAPHGSASEAFFTTGAGVAATLLVASTIAATTILSRVPRDPDLALLHVIAAWSWTMR
jgi:hypothetical protein